MLTEIKLTDMKKIVFTLILAATALGMQAKTIDLSEKESANCYMVGRSGSYSFRADIKGNGVETLGHTAAIDMKAVKGVKVIWEDRDIINDSSVRLNGKKITFTTGNGFASGNAVIGLFSDKECTDGNCIWSWHIWLTDASECTIEGYTFLDRNLGAYSTEFGKYGENGCYWQWGRKDPFPADFSVGITSVPGKKSYAYASANPSAFITRNGRWMDVDAHHAWRKDGKKTMYDPCPPGYCVPIYEDIMVIKTSGAETGFHKAGAIWYDLDPSGKKMTGRAGYYWTSTTTEGLVSRSNDLYVYENLTGVKSHYYNDSAMSVRPEKIRY